MKAIVGRGWKRSIVLGMGIPACALLACAGSGEAPPAAPPPAEVTTESAGPTPSERLLPPCPEDGKAAPAFPASSEGADYRAIVLLTIAEDGSGRDLCFRRVEGPLVLEQKALAEREQWRFPTDQAGQKRERTVTYRLAPAAP